jgi:hypothetical protein
MTPQKKQDSLAQCPQCGSTSFYAAEFRQYIVYPPAVPGGGLHPSDAFREVKICACGYPMPIGPVGHYNQAAQSFKKSLAAAQQYLESKSADKILSELARSFITRREYQLLIERLTNLEMLQQQTGQKGKSKEKDKDQIKSRIKIRRADSILAGCVTKIPILTTNKKRRWWCAAALVPSTSGRVNSDPGRWNGLAADP